MKNYDANLPKWCLLFKDSLVYRGSDCELEGLIDCIVKNRKIHAFFESHDTHEHIMLIYQNQTQSAYIWWMGLHMDVLHKWLGRVTTS